MKKLKLCPFCGGDAEIMEGRACLVKTFSPVCKDKRCMGRARKTFRSLHGAINAWNKRVESKGDDNV